MSQFQFAKIYGRDLENYYADISRIRMAVFREWPYLYGGSEEFERKYLSVYFENPRSMGILVKQADEVIGISTMVPLAGEHEEMKKPVSDFGFDINEIFYYAETCILPKYRGGGIYKEIFRMREEHAKSFGDDYKKVCFFSVIRPDDHPRKPANYRPLDEVWSKYGFQKVEGLMTGFTWQDVDDDYESRKQLSVWMKDL